MQHAVTVEEVIRAGRLEHDVGTVAYERAAQAVGHLAYRRIAGRPPTAADRSPQLLESLGRMVSELHDFPVDRAAELLDIGPAELAWRRRFEDLWPVVERDALPCLDPTLADRVCAEYERFLESAVDVPSCLVHNDLGAEHVLLAEAGSRPVGMIDFESSWVGDPAVDLVPLVALFGADSLDPLVAGRDLGADLRDRMWFYRWMGSVHAVIYGVQHDLDHERNHGIDELQRRVRLARPSG